MSFRYPPLPSGDGLRILSLHSASDFWAPLEGTLRPVSFASKPRYIALSYTWADPDPEHASIPAMPVPITGQQPSKQTTVPSPGKGGGDESKPAEANIPPSPVIPNPRIVLNGYSLPLFHNVALALRFLRSPTDRIELWVDAICINQGSLPERNSQVALMAFIFTRATAVVSWLGVPDTIAPLTANSTELQIQAAWKERLSVAWADSKTKHLATMMQGELEAVLQNAEAFPWSDERFRVPNRRLHLNPYWSRLWVVQEVCLPRVLLFMCGGEVWPEWMVKRMATATEQMGTTLASSRYQTLGRLLMARRERFTDAMRLEALVERFMGSGCVEVRDHVFGLVGLANDVDSFALEIPSAVDSLPYDVLRRRASSPTRGRLTPAEGRSPSGGITLIGNTAVAAIGGLFSGGGKGPSGDVDYPIRPNQVAKKLQFGKKGVSGASRADPGQIPPPYSRTGDLVIRASSPPYSRGTSRSWDAGPKKPQRGRGLLEINYERSFYDIWRDVVWFMHFQAKPLHDFGKEAEEMEDERSVKVVRFAGVVQRAFEGKVDEEVIRNLEARSETDEEQDNSDDVLTFGQDGNLKSNIIQAKGYVAGKIVHMGPTYTQFVGSYREQQRWLGSWDSHYHESSDLVKLREMEEAYSAKIMEFAGGDLWRIRDIKSENTLIWSVLRPTTPRLVPRMIDAADDSSDDELPKDPVRFLATELCMGLAPPDARAGDFVVRFWNCDAAIVVRPVFDFPSVRGGNSGAASKTGEYEIVYKLVGRADVAERQKRDSDTDNMAKDAMTTRFVREPNSSSADLKPHSKAVYVRMSFEILQEISAHITI